MCTIITSVLLSVVIGAVASFIVWVIPAEKFKPKIRLVCYNQKTIEDSVKNSKGEMIKYYYLKRNVHIVNDSFRFSAYNITCFAELLDEENNIVYREEKRLPIVQSNTTETNALILPFERLSIAKLKKENVIKIKLNLVYENRYGTKKTSGPWWIRDYDLEKKTFEPKLDM